MYKYIAGVIGVLVVAFGLIAFGAYFATIKTDAAWQKRWDRHLADDQAATARANEAQRTIESTDAKAVAEGAEIGQAKIDVAVADADADRKSRDGLRNTVDAYVGKLAASQARLSSCVTSASKAASEGARVLADVLSRADERAGILAGNADQAIERGLTCERSYDAIKSSRIGK